ANLNAPKHVHHTNAHSVMSLLCRA
ncbi:50S ribosomal protein L35, partial [Helicobacter pylori]